MQYVATRTGRKGPTHKEEATRLYGQFVHTLVGKADLADQLMARDREFEDFKKDIAAKLPDMIQQAMQLALAQSQQPAAVEDGSTKG